MLYIAHFRKRDNAEQSVVDHLRNVQTLAEERGAKIGLKHAAGLAGILHDMGKFSEAFQTYIKEAQNNPQKPPQRGSVDHSTAGGKLIYEKYQGTSYQPLAEVMSNVIISHHGGLQDYITLDLFTKSKTIELPVEYRVSEKNIEGYAETKKLFFEKVMTEKALDDYMKKADVEFRNILSKSKEDSYIPISLITKYLFSCLVDADRLDARAFELSETIGKIENNHSFFSTSYNALLKHLETFENKTVIQKLRQEMSEQCDAFASNSSAIYRLSIPTGGGKTLASLLYALKHALLHQKQRIIYVVPFTTIIEQNAKIVRDILQNDTEILEHHSNVIENTAECDDDPKSVEEMHLNLMKDNWDAPIIFTTMVQYLNVLYNNGTRDVRRLHNLTDAVIIFDEVQAVPLKCITLFNDSVNFLKSICDVSVLLCTATQPALELVKNKLDIAEQSEIIANSDAVREQFKRVLVKDYTEDAGWSIKKLASFILMGMSAVTNILVVLNTKRAVAELYQELEKITTDSLYHLSTGMCAKHRQVTLAKIKADLKAKKRLICVSTPLIEAGVDISFQRVIRSLAGMDAIAQAAGRCNRHGEEEVQTVYIIKLQEKVEVTTALGAVHKGKNITKTILEQSKITNKQQTREVELLSAKAMSNYFNVLFKDLDKELDYPLPRKNITLATLLGRNQVTRDAYKHTKISPYPYVLASSMKTSGANFNVIDDKTVAVIVHYGEGEKIIGKLNGNPSLKELNNLFKQAQYYTINLYQNQIIELERKGLVFPLFNGYGYALVAGAYDNDIGLDAY